MDYRQFGSTYLVRIDLGEDLVGSILSVCKKEDIQLAIVDGFGALTDFKVGVWDLATKSFLGNDFSGKYEMAALAGNITLKEGEPYLHAHMSAGDETGKAVGGHLISATVGATAEISITRLEGGSVGRRQSEVSGVFIMDF